MKLLPYLLADRTWLRREAKDDSLFEFYFMLKLEHRLPDVLLLWFVLVFVDRLWLLLHTLLLML